MDPTILLKRKKKKLIEDFEKDKEKLKKVKIEQDSISNMIYTLKFGLKGDFFIDLQKLFIKFCYI